MTGILLDQIGFENYRQYGTGTLHFNNSRDNMLSVVIAKNGTGKTTLLNSITWCLYEKEFQLTDETTALPVVNSGAVAKADIGQILPVSVRLIIVDGNKVVEFKRTQRYKVSINSEGIKTGIPGPSFLTASITTMGDLINTKIKTGVDADILAKQYFDIDIYDFYFFDGEKLRDFFSAGRAKNIKRSIFNISQVTLLDNACTHTKKMRDDKTRKLGKESPDIERLTNERDAQEKQKELAEETLKASQENLDQLKAKRDKHDEVLRGFEPIKKLQVERIKLEQDLKDLENEEKILQNDRSEFIRKYIVLLNLYPRIKHTLDIIEQKEKDGDLPPAIDKEQVKKMLDHLDEPCPLCNGKIGEDGRLHLEKLIQRISVSSKTSNYLKEIKSSLEIYISEAQEYKIGRKTLIQRATELEESMNKIICRLKEINGILANYEGNDQKVNVSKIEREREQINDQIEIKNQAIGAALASISACEKQLTFLDKEISSATSKLQEHEDIKAQIEVLEMLNRNFEAIRQEITGGMKQEIETTTWNFFDAMIWKCNTFGKISIDDNYRVLVYNKSGALMTGSMSATEHMALAYAFTLAIHQASGKNCPLVIDSPLGRVSDDNRENMAKALLEVSCDKQIIMLFTPDEYSEPVKQLYAGNVDVRVFNLSDDESYVEGIER